MADSLSTRCLAGLLFAAISFSLPGRAQDPVQLEDVTDATQGIELGATAPKPAWGEWLLGEPVAHAEGGTTVLSFHTGSRGPSLTGDGDYLSELQRRFADRGLSIVAVVGEGTSEAPGNVAPCRVVVDAKGATTQQWFGEHWPGDFHVVLLDGNAQVTFRGEPGHGLVDAIERTLADKPAIDREQQAWFALEQVDSNFDSMVGAMAIGLLDPVLAHSPHHGHALGLRYLADATKRHDAAAASRWRELATGRLANESRPLAVFVDLALRGQPRSRALALQLAAALVPATAAAPNDPFVQLAYLRALVLAGRSRQVGRQAMTTRKLVFDDAAHCVTFCEILTQDATPQVHRDLCELAIAKAEELGAARRQLVALRYVVAKRCAEDEAAAAGIVAAYVKDLGQRISINNDCWYFMTDLPTMGRHDVFAAALAEKMLEEREQMDSFEFDTAALAMFLAGRVDEAVELQEAALAKGAQGNPEYVERLERYRAAAADAKKAGGEAGKDPQSGK